MSEHNSKFTQAPGIDRRKKSIIDPLASSTRLTCAFPNEASEESLLGFASTNHLKCSPISVRVLPNGDVVFMTKCFVGKEEMERETLLCLSLLLFFLSITLSLSFSLFTRANEHQE